MQRFVSAFFCFLLTAFAAETANADLRADGLACDSKVDKVRVAGCTRLIASGRVPKAMAWIPYHQRGQGYAMQKRYGEALADYNKGIALKPTSTLYNNRGDANKALKNEAAAHADYDRAIAIDPKNYEPLHNKAMLLVEQSQYDKALSFYERALAINPKHPFILNGRGLVWSKKRDFDRALADFDDSIRLNPNYIDPYINIGGGIYAARGEFDRGLAYLDQAIRLNPSSRIAFHNRAGIYSRKGQADLALADVERAISLDPRSSLSIGLRGEILYSKDDFDGAVVAFDKALQIDSTNIGVYFARGLAHQKLGDFPQAEADFEQVIRAEPDNGSAYAGRALVQVARGDVTPALENYDKAIQFDPTHAGQFTLRGLAREKVADYDGARADFKSALALPRMHFVRNRGVTSVTLDNFKDQEAAKARLLVLGESSESVPMPQAPLLPPAQKAEPNATPRELGRRIALILGNGAYENANKLLNPANDAKAIGGALKNMGFEISEGIDLGKDALQQKIATFLREAPTAKLLVLFYAGHGMQIDGKNYLVPIDARFDDTSSFTSGMLDMDTIMSALDGKLTTNIVILDACRDNPMAQDAAVQIASRSVRARSGLAAPSGVGAGESAGAGTLIAFATAPGQVALDGDGANSPFSLALTRHIATAGLEVQQMMTRVRAEVVASTKGKQVPWSNSALVGEVYLKSN